MSNTINKADLVGMVADKTEMSKTDAAVAVEEEFRGLRARAQREVLAAQRGLEVAGVREVAHEAAREAVARAGRILDVGERHRRGAWHGHHRRKGRRGRAPRSGPRRPPVADQVQRPLLGFLVQPAQVFADQARRAEQREGHHGRPRRHLAGPHRPQAQDELVDHRRPHHAGEHRARLRLRVPEHPAGLETAVFPPQLRVANSLQHKA